MKATILSHLQPLLALCVCLSLIGCKGNDEGGSSDGGLGGAEGSGDGTGDGDKASEGATKKQVLPTNCEEDSDCSDDIYCNGSEKCGEGLCRQGKAVKCDDDIECTIDRCDEGAEECIFEAPDEDGDGHQDVSCLDEEGDPLGDDCDDDDARSFPGNAEVCDADNRDEDCNPSTLGERDSDNDGYNDALCCNEDEDGELVCGKDCDDHKSNVNPEATEACDFLDNNCNGKVDEGVSIDLYPDADHDGHGSSIADAEKSCAGAVGYAKVANDCDDDDPEVFLGQFEICDNKDNNCDGKVDEVHEQAPWYKDEDGDTYGDAESTPVFSCYRPKGRVMSRNDCNDGNKKVNPNATEICDALDNDCNGKADFNAGGVNNFEDDDGDGVADADCGGDDCDDNDRRTAAGAEEVCDHVDNDCDGEVDEQTVQNIWYIDEDGDGWGVVIGSALASCDPIAARASSFGDCDDTDNAVHPETTEYCDGVDNNCNGEVDEGANVHCKRENALSICSNGSCAIFSCISGFADSDNDPENGCEKAVTEADRMTDTDCVVDSDCSDGNGCTGTETCSNGKCRLGTAINCDANEAIIQGEVTITGGQDLRTLGVTDTITGDLVISGTALSSLIGLEHIRNVGGSLIIRGNLNLLKLSGSALSNLEVVGGDIIIDNNPSLLEVYLPSLLSAGGIDILLDSSPSMKSVRFPSLVQVNQRVGLASVAPNLAEILIPELVTAGAVSISHTPQQNNALKVVNFSSLSTVIEAVSIYAEIAVTSDDSGLFMDQLRTVGAENNDGAVELCTGTPGESAGEYDNAACDAIDELKDGSDFSGDLTHCGECGEEVSGDGDGDGDQDPEPVYGDEGPSCGDMLDDACQGESCCTSIVLPAGTFMMGRSLVSTDSDYAGDSQGAETPEHTVGVSSFALDKYEITVGRFRAYAEGYTGVAPRAVSGGHPKIAGTGWDSSWDTNLPADNAALLIDIKCGGAQTWTDAAGESETEAMNCLSWYQVFAFCLWDGGRLPTEAEWEYAAAGGLENRLRPWGAEAASSGAYANYNSNLEVVDVVGNFPSGNARWGHADLIGNLFEWTLDDFNAAFYSEQAATGDDVGNFTASASNRTIRGGSFGSSSSYIRSAYRASYLSTSRDSYIGARCARDEQK